MIEIIGALVLFVTECMDASLFVLESVLDLERILIELRLPIFDLELRIGDRGDTSLWREETGESSPPPLLGELLGVKFSLGV